MNLIDLALILLLVLSAVRGVRLGASMQVLSYGGFWLGLLGGALLAPPVAHLVHGPVARSVVSLVVVFGAASVVGGLGRGLGARAGVAMRRVHLGLADAGVGAVVAASATLLTAWVVAAMLSSSPWPALSRQVQSSAVIKVLNRTLPPAPDLFSRVQSLLTQHGFPQVLAQPGLPRDTPISLPGAGTVSAAAAAAGPSTVKIVGQGCGEMLEGSGFVVAHDLVVTNAHVIAGTDRVEIQDDGPNGTHVAHPATPVFFDPRYDLAVLRTTGLNEAPLRIMAGNVAPGTQATVLGYPNGGPFDVQAAAVQEQFNAEGRDIYNSGLTFREVYQLKSLIRPGNSGGPLVDASGQVLGVVFSRSASVPDVGYALSSPGVLREVQTAEQSSGAVSTGPCAN